VLAGGRPPVLRRFVLAGKMGDSASEPRSWTQGFINISQMIMFFLGDEERFFMVRYENKNAK
jgi:hypothetical protein